MPAVAAALENGPEVPLPGYLSRDAEPYTSRVVGQPSRGDIPFDVDEMAVIEFYAR
jgi:hypothetical protein